MNLKLNCLFFLIFFIVFSPEHLSAQTEKIDSLKNVLTNLPVKDSSRANTLIGLCKAFLTEINDKENVQVYIRELLSLSKEIGIKKGIAYAHMYMGLTSMGKSDYGKALEHY